MGENWQATGNVAGVSDQVQGTFRKYETESDQSVVNVNNIDIRIDSDSMAKKYQGQAQAQDLED